MDERDFVLAAPTTAAISDISSYVSAVTTSNPITTFLAARSAAVLAGQASILEPHPLVGRLLLVGIMSDFENYCRSVMAECLMICPICQAKTADKNVNLGGAIWHGPKGNFNLSAFEHKSFADVKELKSTFKEYINFELSDNVFQSLLDAFDKIVQLRHAIVHSGGFLPGRNAVKLEIPRDQRTLLVDVNQTRLQESILVISNLAETINRELFSSMCNRWAIGWRKRADWRPEKSGQLLGKILSIFVDKAYNSSLPAAKRTKGALQTFLTTKYNLE